MFLGYSFFIKLKRLKMSHVQKIIFSGPVRSGKTTAIHSLSDITPISTDQMASDNTASIKEETTVAMDYGLHLLENGSKIHLYGTPGQARFSFMWDVLAKNGTGLILLFDNTRPSPKADLELYIKAFTDLIVDTKLIIGVTHTEQQKEPSLAQYSEWLAEHHLTAEVYAIDAREREDVKRLVGRLMH